MSTKGKKKTGGSGSGEEEEEDLYFKGIVALFVEPGIQSRRLQIWKQKLQRLGGTVEEHRSKRVTHVFAATVDALAERLGGHKKIKANMVYVKYEWIEDCLKAGKRLPADSYILKAAAAGDETVAHDDAGDDSCSWDSSTQRTERSPSGHATDSAKRAKTADWMKIIKDGDKMGVVPRGRSRASQAKAGGHHDARADSVDKEGRSMDDAGCELSTPEISSSVLSEVCEGAPNPPEFLKKEPELGYTPPNLNAHITGPFTEIRDIYKEALGDDRRYFSYYKALSVLEKVPFKITSVDQIKGLPTIGKSLMEHIQEILTTGRMLKLEHLKNDDKVRVISLFGSVWGIGPATAQKLYDKGHRSLEDLEADESLTHAQRTGLKFHFDIIKKIPRHEIAVMEAIVQKAAEEIRPNISVLCGGSYRRGKAMSGDMDFVITHPDGHSHKGLLSELLTKLKAEGFLTEDLMHGPQHSTEGTDSGVDTYFGLCKYPGREQRHRIDFKIYPLDQYPFGLIAWTGNDVLNRRLRLLAAANGYKLDDHGLFPVVRDEHGNEIKSPASVPCKSEREVFETLGFPWLEPHERNL